jgi:hypothetical protein
VEESLDRLYARRGVLPFSVNLLFENKRITELRAAGRAEATVEAMNSWLLVPTIPEASLRLFDHSIPGDLWVEVSTPECAQLVFLNAFDNGWRAEINGRRQDVQVALGAFVGVALDRGASTVHLYHSGRWWTVVAGAHFVGLIGIALASRRSPFLARNPG